MIFFVTMAAVVAAGGVAIVIAVSRATPQRNTRTYGIAVGKTSPNRGDCGPATATE